MDGILATSLFSAVRSSATLSRTIVHAGRHTAFDRSYGQTPEYLATSSQCPTPGGSKAAFGCSSVFAWLETVGIRRSFLLTAIARQEQLFQVFARAIVSVFV